MPTLTFGRVYRLHSKNFGTHDILIVRAPGQNHEERFRGMEILPNGESRELLHASSFETDTVEKEWPNLFHYYAEVVGETSDSEVTAAYRRGLVKGANASR